MIRPKLKVMAAAAVLSLGLAAAAYAQNFVFRTDVTGTTGEPSILLTLINSSGLGCEVDAAGAEPGTVVDGEIRTLTYRNEVSRSITVSSVSITPNTDNFVILADGCTGTVAMGGQCTVQVQFRASDDGSYAATMSLVAQ